MPDKAVTVRLTGPLLLSGALALAVAGCDRPQSSRPAPTPPSPVVAAPPEPAADGILDRAAILTAINTAASDAAVGRAAPVAADALAGRRFRMRIAFGCPGPAPAGETIATGVPGWSRSADGKTVRLSFTPADWTGGDPSGPPVEGFESVGGVWISHPWIRTADCPVAATPATGTSTIAASPTVGLALLRADGASRLGRDDSRAFTHTVRGKGDAPTPDPVAGYRLVLEGRLTPWADGRVIRCVVTRAESRPVCVAGVIIDHLAYEDGATGETLGEWRPG